jgi:CheY-like chemotaxis protein
MRILIADDEVVSRTKAARLLGKHGECVAVDSGDGAVAKFKAAAKSLEAFHVVFMDIEMPGMDGVQALRAIREFEAQNQVAADARVPVIMLTSHSDSDVVAASIQAGCTDYIVKPFGVDTLTAKIEKHIKVGRLAFSEE